MAPAAAAAAALRLNKLDGRTEPTDDGVKALRTLRMLYKATTAERERQETRDQTDVKQALPTRIKKSMVNVEYTKYHNTLVS